jgi:hypothetical protein
MLTLPGHQHLPRHESHHGLAALAYSLALLCGHTACGGPLSTHFVVIRQQ